MDIAPQDASSGKWVCSPGGVVSESFVAYRDCTGSDVEQLAARKSARRDGCPLRVAVDAGAVHATLFMGRVLSLLWRFQP